LAVLILGGYSRLIQVRIFCNCWTVRWT